MSGWQLRWDSGRASVQRLGGMLGPVQFRLANRWLQPMAVAPWGRAPMRSLAHLPALLRRLRGEWPCVPFGAPTAPAALPEHWPRCASAEGGDHFHGYAAHHDWRLLRRRPDELLLAIDYPSDSAVAGLRRSIRAVPGRPELSLCLEIHMRREARLPIALHPVFRLPAVPGALLLQGPRFRFARSYPMAVEAGVSRLLPDAVCRDLRRVPLRGGGALSLRCLGLPFATEELIQLCGVDGRVALWHRAGGYRVVLHFDPALFPSVLLWLSQRGRTAEPWCGRHLALGVEPVCAAFDLGAAVSAHPDNPIARAGVATARLLPAGCALRSEYRIAIEAA